MYRALFEQLFLSCVESSQHVGKLISDVKATSAQQQKSYTLVKVCIGWMVCCWSCKVLTAWLWTVLNYLAKNEH